MDYQFPVTDVLDALDVTNPEFPIGDKLKQLYADINPFRYNGDNLRPQLNKLLRIIDDKLHSRTDRYVKIIFSGHRGCGKSLELERHNEYLNASERYFSVLIDMEKELAISQFRPEDIFVVITTNLAQQIHDKKIPLRTKALDEVAREWFRTTITNDSDGYGGKMEATAEASMGANILSFIKLKTSGKAIFSTENKTTTTIREEIKAHPQSLIDKLNEVFAEVREHVLKANLGKDILFIIDGSEKLHYKDYQEVFIHRNALLSQLNVNAIFTVPIRSSYEIEYSTAQGSYLSFRLPMVKLDLHSIPHLKEIITKRIDHDTFFDQGVLDHIVKMSGGCPRELLRVVNRCLLEAKKTKIDLSTSKTTMREMGREMFERLKEEHKNIIINKLPKGDISFGNPAVLEMLLELVLYKYNGETSLNPLLTEFFK